MTDDREAFEAALRAHIKETGDDRAGSGFLSGWQAALTRARAQAGEPVAWQWRYRSIDETIGGYGEWGEWAGDGAPKLRGADYEVEERPLCTHPAPAKEEAENAE